MRRNCFCGSAASATASDDLIVSGAGTAWLNGRYVKGRWGGDFGTHGVNEIWRHETHHEVVIGYYATFGTPPSSWWLSKWSNDNDWYGAMGSPTDNPADLEWWVVRELGTSGAYPPPTIRRAPPERAKPEAETVANRSVTTRSVAIQ